jgi:hypothetical protein
MRIATDGHQASQFSQRRQDSWSVFIPRSARQRGVVSALGPVESRGFGIAGLAGGLKPMVPALKFGRWR